MWSCAQYDDALVTLIGDTASNYVQIRMIGERLEVARENAAIQERSLALAEVKRSSRLSISEQRLKRPSPHQQEK